MDLAAAGGQCSLIVSLLPLNRRARLTAAGPGRFCRRGRRPRLLRQKVTARVQVRTEVVASDEPSSSGTTLYADNPAVNRPGTLRSVNIRLIRGRIFLTTDGKQSER